MIRCGTCSKDECPGCVKKKSRKKRYRVRVTQRVWEEGWVEVEARSRGDALRNAPAVVATLGLANDSSWKYGGTEDGSVEAWEAEEIKDR